MRKALMITVFALLSIVCAMGQQKFVEDDSYGLTFRQILREAELAFEEDKDYYRAMSSYEDAFRVKPNRLDLKYRYAEAARLVGSYARAKEAYQYVYQKDDDNKFPLSGFWLANMNQMLGEYTLAISGYDKFLRDEIGNEKVKSDIIDRAKLEMLSCEWSRDIAQEQNNVTVKHLDGSINTPNKEFGAFILNDTLYYSSLNFESEADKGATNRSYARIMFSDDDKNGVELTNGINDTLRHTANLVLNTAQDKRYFTRCDYLDEFSAEIDCDLFVQTKNENGIWSEPTRLPDHVNIEGYTQTHPSVAVEGGKEYLYFVSNQPGGKGALDIWRTQLEEDDGYTMPENLFQINTIENDVTPHYHDPSKTLYFSSEGRQGLGGFDVYKVQKLDDGWGEIKNMGKPLNSSLNDLYFTISKDGSTGYLSSNRVGSTFLDKDYELCCDDLYAAEFDIKVKTLVYTFDDDTKESLEETELYVAEIREDGSLEELAYNLEPAGNEHLLFLERGKSYVLKGSKDGYEMTLDTFSVDMDAADEITTNMYLKPIVVDVEVFVYDLDNRTPLFDALVQIIEIDGEEENIIHQQSNEYGNDFYFTLERGKTYSIRASKSGYQPLENLEIDTKGLEKSETFTAELSLKRESFLDHLPLTLYFDNDLPDSNSQSNTTETSYDETLSEYYEKKEEFKILFTDPMDEEDAFLTASRYEAFFERDVKRGLEDLKEFADVLIDFLSGGNEITIRLKGFASPRADAYYNYNLSQRRIVSVENFFRSYKQGVLMPYIYNGTFVIDHDPIGEKNAPNYVISRIEDERNSIYSLGASVERRVEIVEVEVRRNEPENSSSSAYSTKGLDK